MTDPAEVALLARWTARDSLYARDTRHYLSDEQVATIREWRVREAVSPRTVLAAGRWEQPVKERT